MTWPRSANASIADSKFRRYDQWRAKKSSLTLSRAKESAFRNRAGVAHGSEDLVHAPKSSRQTSRRFVPHAPHGTTESFTAGVTDLEGSTLDAIHGRGHPHRRGDERPQHIHPERPIVGEHARDRRHHTS